MSKNTNTRTRKSARTSNPLAKRHFSRITKRPYHRAKRLFPVWGITWNLKGRSVVPIGTASAQIQVSWENDGREAIELGCITAQLDVHSASVDYACVRMSHDFHRGPHPGARGRILDPRYATDGVKAGDRPNGDWVSLALDMDAARVRAAEQNWKLGVVPELPHFLLCYQDMSSIDAEVTPAIVERIRLHMGKSPKEMRQMHGDTLNMLAQTEWPELWLPPQSEENPTNLWAIDHRYVADPASVARAVKVLEDHRHLQGQEVHNPVRDMSGFEFPNPAAACAAAAGFDLREELERAGEDDRLLALVIAVREALGPASAIFDDAAIDLAIVEHDKPLQAPSRFLAVLSDKESVALVRHHIETTKPALSPLCTDEDLLAAARSPGKPLFASKMHRLQVLYRDTRLDLEDALRFDSHTLERERVSANFWPASSGWAHQPQTKQQEQKEEKRDEVTV